MTGRHTPQYYSTASEEAAKGREQRAALRSELVEARRTEEGLKDELEAKSLQARAYVKKEHFGRYELAPEHQGSQPAERLQFGINLATLVECLRILGPGGDVARRRVPRPSWRSPAAPSGGG